MPIKDKYTTRLVIGEGSFVKILLGKAVPELPLIDINDRGFIAEVSAENTQMLNFNPELWFRVEIFITGRKGNLSVPATCRVLKNTGNIVAAKIQCNAREKLKLRQFLQGEHCQLAA